MSNEDAIDFSVSDLEYNVITTLSNLLQSEEVLAKYADDADEAGDAELAGRFRSLRQHNQQHAMELRNALCRLVDQNS